MPIPSTNFIRFKESYGNYAINGPRVGFGNKKGINAVATCELKSGFSVSTVYIINYDPTFIPHVAIDAKVNSKAEIHGSFFYERIYSIDSKEAYYVDNTIFSGIAWEVKGEAEIVKKTSSVKKNPLITKGSVKINESFILIKPYVLKGEKIPLFNKETFKEPK